MFPFRKKTPPTRVEVAKKAVSDAAHALIAFPADMIEDKFDDLKKSAVGAALHAAQMAHHAGEVASHKLEELQHTASALGESASGAVHRTHDSAHAAGEGAAAAAAAKAKATREAAQAAKESLQEKAGLLAGSAVAFKSAIHDRLSHDVEEGKDRAQDAKEDAGQKVEEAKSFFGKRKNDAQEAASEHVEEARSFFGKRKEDAQEAAADKAEEAASRVAKKKAKAEAEIAAVEVPKLPKVKTGGVEVEYTDSSAKWAWILLGLAVGAVVALLFAPTTGRRSRAAIKDRLGKVTSGAADASKGTADKVVDIAHRVEGIAHKVETKLIADAEADDDSILADRVRSVLGHHEAAKAIERINVDSNNGVVTLRGPVVDQATQDTIVAAVKTVPGVKDVVSDFLIDTPVNPANSVG
jgi:gas vesicle protein